MRDAHSKKNISIELKVTDRCDQSCFHCVNDDGPDRGREVDSGPFTARLVEWWEARERSLWHVKEVRMTGGEPLMNLPAVLEIARTCRRLGIRSGINTNASFLNETTAQALKDAGLAVVKVSFDGVDEAALCRMRGPKASLVKTVANIRTAVAHGFRVLLRLTLCTYNVGQLVDCYRMARELGVEKLQVKPLVQSGRAAMSDAFLTRQQLRAAFKELAAAVQGPVALPEILCWPPEDAFGLPNKVCGSLAKIYFSASGEATICNYLADTTPIGNVIQEPLESVLEKRNPQLWQTPGCHTMLAGCPQAVYFVGSSPLLGKDSVARSSCCAHVHGRPPA